MRPAASRFASPLSPDRNNEFVGTIVALVTTDMAAVFIDFTTFALGSASCSRKARLEPEYVSSNCGVVAFETSITVLPANSSASIAETVSSAADPRIALTTTSAPLTQSAKLVTSKPRFLELGSRDPNVISCPALRHAPESITATLPVPRMPSFMIAPLLQRMTRN
jgi:hypothetical protein